MAAAAWFDGIPGQDVTISILHPVPAFGGTQDIPGHLCVHGPVAAYPRQSATFAGVSGCAAAA